MRVEKHRLQDRFRIAFRRWNPVDERIEPKVDIDSRLSADFPQVVGVGGGVAVGGIGVGVRVCRAAPLRRSFVVETGPGVRPRSVLARTPRH